jgi:hypothetical protein
MSILIPTNTCSPNLPMISLQEESPELDSKAKTKCQSPSKNAKSKEFPKQKNIFSEESELKLSFETDNKNNAMYTCPCYPTNITEESKNNFKKFILDTIKNDDELALKDKLAFSLFLVMNTSGFNEELINEFNEEECHLSLLNWIWRYNKKLKQFQLEHQLKINLFQNFDTFLPNYNKLLIEINIIMELLINILNFLAFLPINSSDILHLKLYEKLFKIKGYIKSYANEYLINLINFVLDKWKAEVEAENEAKIITRYKLNQLGIKRPRSQDDKDDKEDTEADSVDDNENNIKINNINDNKINSNLNKKTKKNNIKVSFDLQNNSVIYFKKDDTPFQISLDKQKNEKSNFS